MWGGDNQWAVTLTYIASRLTPPVSRPLRAASPLVMHFAKMTVSTNHRNFPLDIGNPIQGGPARFARRVASGVPLTRENCIG
jgi:hypothetical protein